MCIYLKHIRFLSQFDQEGKKQTHVNTIGGTDYWMEEL